MSDAKSSGFDENKASTEMDRYSRAIAALGVDTMKSMGSFDVLVIGLTGVGVETAKDLILAGPRAVTVWDNQPAELHDLGTNFYLNKEHVDKKVRRSVAVVKALAELNPYVQVDASEVELTEKFIQHFGAVVLTQTLPTQQMLQIDEWCRSRTVQKDGQSLPAPVVFVLATTHGLACHFFTDFGPAHVVTDKDGEPKKSHVIEKITNEGVVTVAAKSHDFDDGDLVNFEEVGGLDALNKVESVPVKRIYTKYTERKNGKNFTRERQVFNQFQVDLAALKIQGSWTGGGIVNEVKPKIVMPFRSLKESLVNPSWSPMGLSHPDDSRFFAGRSNQLHFAYLAVLAFQDKHKQLPKLHDEKDASECVELAKAELELHKKKPENEALVVEAIDEAVVRNYALYARAELSGYCAFLGGVAAQEVVKKFGKFTPVHQWLHCDHFELLDEKVPEDAKPIGSRYDHQISVFGQAFQRKLSDQRWFLVGAGALGCEYLKAFALLGVGCGPNGKVIVTDMDRIELSNLSRQFLFRGEHVGKPKSVCASAVVKTMNPDMNVLTYEQKVGPETEDLFDDEFWEGLTGVWNALDNVQARRYTDAQCLIYGKPLMESGTQGTKANSEIVLPHETKSYNDNKDQDTGAIAACTLRNFPHLILHCIEWAKPAFQGLFDHTPSLVNALIDDKAKFLAKSKKQNAGEQLETLSAVKALIDETKDRSYSHCIQMGLNEFVTQYRNRIKDLIHFFPENERVKDPDTGEDAGPFWSGHKRFPQVADFNINDDLHCSYLQNAANLFAVVLGVEPIRDKEQFKAAYAKAQTKVPEWVPPKKAIKIDDDKKQEEKKEEGPSDDDEKQLADLFDYFEKLDTKSIKKLTPQEFEKDDDTNFHIDFITAASNMRAWNYRIKETTRHNCKMVAGKIIAALATTTAMITGLVTLEYYKFVKGLKANKFFNANVNLAAAKFNFWEVEPPIKAVKKFDETMQMDMEPIPAGYTSWDFVVVDQGDLTLEQFLEAFPKIHNGVTVDMLLKRGITQEDIDAGRGNAIYGAGPTDLKGNLKDLYVKNYGPISAKKRFIILDGSFSDADGNSCLIPFIKYYFKPRKSA